jgi:phage recombination protein Bet
MSTSLTQVRGPQSPQPIATQEQIALLKQTIAKGCNDTEFSLLMELCRAKRLDPFAKHIQPVKRWDPDSQTMGLTFQTGIDGFRLIAQRTGDYLGQDGPYWCGEDGQWVDVWTKNEPPIASKVGVFRRGFERPVYAVAHYSEYVQTKKDGKPNSMWAKMCCNQLAKCAEALAIRKAFPEDLAGLYTPDEMKQADLPPMQPEPAQTINVTPQVVNRPWATKKQMIQMFDELAARFPERADYLAILSMWDVTDATAFKNGDDAHSCYDKLVEALGA